MYRFHLLFGQSDAIPSSINSSRRVERVPVVFGVVLGAARAVEVAGDDSGCFDELESIWCCYFINNGPAVDPNASTGRASSKLIIRMVSAHLVGYGRS